MTPSERARAFLASPAFPFTVLAITLFSGLGLPPLWTMEGRWGVICLRMMESGDYFNPSLLGEAYYDKPLLSYWVMIAFARLLGGLSETALRLPSAIAGLASAWCLHRLALKLWSREVARLALWMLVGCWSFLHFARVAAADSLNILTVVGAVAWYVERRGRPGFATYAGFFAIIATGCLMKGLVAAVMTVLVVAPDLLAGSRWKSHLKPALLPAALVGGVIYMVPFLAQGSNAGGESLFQVFRENFVRFFNPYDHNKDSWTLYFKFLPLYLAPWTLLLPFVIHRAIRSWKELPPATRWMLLAVAVQFAFLTASRSRRPYYMLPLIPFSIAVIAEWAVAQGLSMRVVGATLRRGLPAWTALVVAWFAVGFPYSATIGGVRLWSEEVRRRAEAIAPWKEWTVSGWGHNPTTAFYLHTPEEGVDALSREQTLDELAARLKGRRRAIIVTRSRSVAEVQQKLGIQGIVIEERPRVPSWLASRIPGSLKAMTRNTDVAAAILLSPP